jgi:hypothetical protein
MVSSKKYSDSLRIFIFLSRKARNFFPEFNVRLYDKNSESDYYFFPLIIYINDIADKLVSLSRLFADDTSFGYSNQDTMQCHLILTKQTS